MNTMVGVYSFHNNRKRIVVEEKSMPIAIVSNSFIVDNGVVQSNDIIVVKERFCKRFLRYIKNKILCLIKLL